MKSLLLTEGSGRTQISLSMQRIGDDIVVFLFNVKGHLGAVALAEYSHQENRASASLMTRLGHRDDVVASNAARALCKRLKKPVCVIAGIHVDSVTEEEIAEIINNCDKVVEKMGAVVSSQ